jgi:HEAT repeat protein
MGDAAKDAIPDLLAALQDKKLKVQSEAALTLVGLASQGTPGLLEKIRAADRKGKWVEPAILKQFGKVPADAVVGLVKNLQDKDENVRVAAVMALAQLGAVAKPAIPALAKALREDTNDQVRTMAAMALARIKRNDIEAAQLSRNALQGFPKPEALLRALQRRESLLEAMHDPRLQAEYDRVILFFIMTTGLSSSQQPPGIDQAAEKAFHSLPPTAVPALVRGLNVVSTYQLGFC